MEQTVRAVSSHFGCHKAGGRQDQSLHSAQVWLTHLFSLVDIDKLQPLSDVPMARGRHPIEEFTAYMSVTFSGTDSDSSLSDGDIVDRLLSTDFSEGFQGGAGCLQLWFGPSAQIVGGKHLEYFHFIEEKAFASCGRTRPETNDFEENGSLLQ
eukprot:s1767_g3.t1